MIQGYQFKNAVLSGSNNIAKYKKQVNELNIFPVPDGDTGTNMSMTAGAAAEGVKALPEEIGIGEAAKKAASTMLRNARGNSGVILSLLFRGLSKGLEGLEEAGAEDLVKALELGVEEAYKAVMKPTEGTMLTVARVAAEQGREALENGCEDPVQIWDAVCIGAGQALEETPELLPVLKRAGVVDAGGQGVCLIFEGMLSVFKSGIIIEAGLSEEEKAQETAEFFRNVAAEFDSEINFTYCTEFIVGRDPEITKDPLDLRLFLETIGDCVVVVDDEEIIKIHVHTENPGNALQAALQYGQLLTVKIENMKEQHRKAAEENGAKKAAVVQAPQPAPARQEPTEEMGFISVAAGDGLKGLFTELGCAVVVSGGQTMNPSTEDLLQAVLATPAKKVFILPNNKNIILAAEQVVPLVTDREVIVLPTRTIPQGISAMLAFDPDSEPEENRQQMLEAASNVDTGLVTFAARDSEFGSSTIRQGDILGLKNGKLDYIEKDPVSACVRVARSLARRHADTSFITLIYGEGITAQQAEEAKRLLAAKVSADVEITLVEGGQPVYYFIISVE